MASGRAKFVLPLIPPPPPKTATVLVAHPELEGPFFVGSGPIDLVCGNCAYVLARGVAQGQIKNLVLKCPSCQSHNAVIDIPALEAFAQELVASDSTPNDIEELHSLLAESQKLHRSPKETTSEVAAQLPEFAWVDKFLLPKDAGEFYAVLGVIIAFLGFVGPIWGRRKTQPSVVVNNFFLGNDPLAKSSRNDPCPCGSGKKFKHCHGKRS